MVMYWYQFLKTWTSDYSQLFSSFRKRTIVQKQTTFNGEDCEYFCWFRLMDQTECGTEIDIYRGLSLLYSFW